MKKKWVVLALLAILIGVATLAVLRWRTHREANYLLDATITAVRDGKEQAHVQIELADGVQPVDFSPQYSVIRQDYTFGYHEFTVKFENGTEYYLDLTEQKGMIIGMVRPSNKPDVGDGL